MKLKFRFISAAFLLLTFNSQAADYIIDTKGGHASINLKIKHLGYSWLTGRFNQFSGDFSYDNKNVSTSKINVAVTMKSFDTNHAARDKHIKSSDFLDVKKFPKAHFVSTNITQKKGDDDLIINGKLTLRGITKNVTFEAEKIGEGKDPWGGYRVGFSGDLDITMADFGVPTKLGPHSTQVTLELNIEGVRKK